MAPASTRTIRGWTNSSLVPESSFLRLTAASGSVIADRTGPSRITPRRRAGIENGSRCTCPGPRAGTLKDATSPPTGNSRVAEPDAFPPADRTCNSPVATSPTCTRGRDNSNSTSCSRLPSTDRTATVIATRHITDKARNSSQPNNQPGIPATTAPASNAHPSGVTEAMGRSPRTRRRARIGKDDRETAAEAEDSGTGLRRSSGSWEPPPGSGPGLSRRWAPPRRTRPPGT